MLSKINGNEEMKWLYGLKTGYWASQGGEFFGLASAKSSDSSSLQSCSDVKKIFADNECMAVLQIFPSAKEDQPSKRQAMFGLAHLDALSRMLEHQPDSYISQATFVGSTRRKCFFSRVRACWVDLDLHTQGMDLDAQTIDEIRLHCESLQLPQPTLIISSGRGAYLKWILQRSVTDLPAWEAAQSMLVILFANFCADKRARDACRVFRMLGTINSKVQDSTRQVVRAIDGAGEEVAFEVLAASLEQARQSIDLPSNLPQFTGGAGVVKQRKPRSDVLNRLGQRLLHAAERGSVDELNLYARLREPILMSGKFSASSLGWTRFCDLRDLYVKRGGIPVGERDTAMFWMMNCLGHAGIVTPGNFKDEVLGLLRAFPQGEQRYEPLQDGSLQTLQQRLFKTHKLKESMQRGDVDLFRHQVDASELLYRPGNTFLIETFEITEQEQSSLKTIIGPQEKQRRSDARVPGRADRRQQRQALKAKIRAWLEDRGGVCDNISALARDFNEAVGRVWRTVQACLREMGLATGEKEGVQGNIKDSLTRDAGSVAVICQKSEDAKVGAAGVDAKTPAKTWSVPARIFAGISGGKRRRKIVDRDGEATAAHGRSSQWPNQRPRSILGSYGVRHKDSLAALRLAVAKPKSAGFKHWMPAFVQDISEHYRRHAQWPTVEQRQALMEWHQQTYTARYPSKQGQAKPCVKSPPQKPVFASDMSHNLSSKSKYLSTKDFFVKHYGEQGIERWNSMTAVQRLHAAIQMERDIWAQARDDAKSQAKVPKEDVRERWLRLTGRDRDSLNKARQAEIDSQKNLLSSAVGSLQGAWKRVAAACSQPQPMAPELAT